MAEFTVSTSPHITLKGNSTRNIMLLVLIALVPCVIAATLFFGYHVLINVAVCAVACFFTEYLYGLIAKGNKKLLSSSAMDLSSVVTGVILALNLPATMNIWGLNLTSGQTVLLSGDCIIACLIGSVFAIVLVKMLFGGIGSNFANPACTARIFLFLCFGAAFTSSATNGVLLDAWTGATWLSGNVQTDGDVLINLLVGNTASAAVGETCAIAIIASCVFLIAFKVIDWKIPVIVVGGTAVFTTVFAMIDGMEIGAPLFMDTLAQVLSGGLLFGAVFMATDYATSPNTTLGTVIYAIGIALITSIIRAFAGYPEGMSFAILIMNIVTPLLDMLIVPKPFGGKVKEGK